MTVEFPVLDVTFPANADLSTHQYKFVKLVSGGKVDLCSATTDKPIGILQNKPGANQGATVRVMGVSKVIAAGTSTLGDSIGTGATGLAVTLTSAGTTLYAVATLLVASSANDVVDVLVDAASTHKHA